MFDFKIRAEDSPEKIQYTLSQLSTVGALTPYYLTQAILVLCSHIDKLETRIKTLEDINASQVDMNVKYK